VEEPGEVPAGTVRVARRAFPKGSLAIRVRDELGVLFRDQDFAAVFPGRGKPAWSPGRSALVVVLQFVEGLTDRQAAEAVRARIDWKYALGLELEDPGFDYSVLSEFGTGWWPAIRAGACWTRFWRRPRTVDYSRAAGGPAPTPRRCSRRPAS
jgi:transposase